MSWRVAGLLFLAQIVCFAQQASIRMFGEKLVLGMDKKSVLEQMALWLRGGAADFQEIGCCKESFKASGYLLFKEGKLVEAIEYVEPPLETSATDLLRSLVLAGQRETQIAQDEYGWQISDAQVFLRLALWRKSPNEVGEFCIAFPNGIEIRLGTDIAKTRSEGVHMTRGISTVRCRYRFGDN
jgi:hypothetical protein